jgi:hypothetical protein
MRVFGRCSNAIRITLLVDSHRGIKPHLDHIDRKLRRLMGSVAAELERREREQEHARPVREDQYEISSSAD